MKSRSEEKQFIIYNIANGDLIILWHDIWCQSSPLMHNPQVVAEIHLPLDANVSQLILDGRWSNIVDNLNNITLREDIKNTPINSHLREDRLIWKPYPSGQFSASNAYKVLSPIRPKVRWQRMVWGNYSKEILIGIKFVLGIAYDTRSSNRELSSLLRLCKRGAQIGDIYASFICASLDAIWKERNARRLKNNSKPVAVVLSRIIREMRVYLHIQISVLQDSPESRSLCQSLGTGYGGVIQDGHGTVIEAYSGSGGIQLVIFQELKAIEIGLIRCHELEVQDIEMESDSLWAIQIIKNVVDTP
ncbi:hypothetical protein IFM89_013880 [Coptis chinensis]|uniref:RNase H type-1 domain-containing protein n=1 Tax=Coptis chinensis TaxID=261450 RepID=A0A835HEE6_9MAGN|nr:hypothetical protein IFM89_013880 [Coptis chinensis]